jgi:hypothetical protein
MVGMVKGQRDQAEETPAGQVQDNLNMKIWQQEISTHRIKCKPMSTDVPTDACIHRERW